MKGEVYPAADGWRFRIKGGNNEIMCTGEAYVRRTDAESALRQLFSGQRFDVTVRDHGGVVVDHFTLPMRHGLDEVYTGPLEDVTVKMPMPEQEEDDE